MKQYKKIILLGAGLFWLSACEKEDKLAGGSVLMDVTIPQNDLDKYIYTKYTQPYNIQILYKYVDKESDMNYHLVPAPWDGSVRMTKLLHHLCIEPYNELTGGTDFIRNSFPKLITYTGSVPVRNNGTIVIGTAESGTKVSLYNLINLDEIGGKSIEFLNGWFLKTIHHEFQHILNQNKAYASSFAEVSGLYYVQDDWNRVFRNLGHAVSLGFVSMYAAKSHEEDFAELYSFYVTSSEAEFDEILFAPESTPEGRAILLTKLAVVKSYMISEWGVDMDELRANILNRYSNLDSFDQTTLN